MATEVSYLEIDSLGEDDVNDLFNAICTDIINLPIAKVKREVFNLNGKDKALLTHKATINELLSLISLYDIKVNIKLTFLSKKFDNAADDIKHVEEPFKESDVERNLKNQVKDINNPDLKDIKNEDFLVKDHKKTEPIPIDPNSIPDFI